MQEDSVVHSEGENRESGLEDISHVDQLLIGVELVEGLTRKEQAMLAFERQWWKFAGSKDIAIKESFEVSPTRYYQILNALIDNPAALEHDPLLIKRLRRIRAQRYKMQSARKWGVMRD